jgi:low temperature requirement protein LtrA
MIQKLIGLHMPMPARDHTESHRAATTLELLYDLVVVIAVAFVAHALQHALVENHTGSGVLSYVMIFWSIWWAWMSFTWFASYYDTDDAPYRVAVFIQMVGALIMAASVEKAEHHDYTMVMIGYIIMRISSVALWVRVIKSNPADRITAMRYAVGTTLCQIGWMILILFLPKSFILPGFFILLVCEHFVPFYGDIRRQSRWHRHHIIERYGLLTIIVLGESLMALATTIQKLAANFDPLLLSIALGGFLILFSMWWLYFDEEEHPVLQYSKRAFIWGYGHFFIFAAIAATGTGLAVVTEQLSGHAKIGPRAAVYSVAIPVAIYLLALWSVHDLPGNGNIKKKLQFPIAAALIVLVPFFLPGVLVIGGLLVGLLLIRLR